MINDLHAQVMRATDHTVTDMTHNAVAQGIKDRLTFDAVADLMDVHARQLHRHAEDAARAATMLRAALTGVAR